MQKASLYHVCRSPHAYPVDEEHFRVVLKAAGGDLEAATCIYGDRYSWPAAVNSHLPMERLGSDGLHEYWGVTLPTPTRRVRYYFFVEGRDGSSAWLGETGLLPRRSEWGHFQHSYIHRGDRFRQPDWIQQAVLYEIFPDRFCNGDMANDPPNCMAWGEIPSWDSVAGGDLVGIQQKLTYLQELGVNCLYTTPIFEAPTNHKYDTTDYYQIDPAFGTNDQFRELVREAHRRGFRFLLDAVFNHSGREWFAFRDVIKKGLKSRYAGWFYDLYSVPVNPAACNYETFANQISSMPKLDTSNPQCAEYLLKVAEHWVREAEIDGWRLDVSNEVDSRFWRAFRNRVKALKPDAFILGEIWHDATEWLQGDQYDSVMNYPWRDATLAYLKGQIDAREYDGRLTRLRFNHPAEVLRGLVNLLGSHDTARVRTELGSREKAAQAAVLLLTAEGVPMVYYGDEIGMEGKNDPDCRRCYPWDEPEQQDSEMLALYRRLIAVRNAFPWLNDGAWETFMAGPVTNVLGFRRLPTPLGAPARPAGEVGLTVVINNSPRAVSLTLPASGQTDLLAGLMLTGEVREDLLILPPHGVAVLAPAALAATLVTAQRGEGA